MTAAGERVEDYTKLRNRVWNWVQPEDFGDEILANDIVYNFWGRERVRRSQTADLQNRLRNLDFYLPRDKIEPLKIRFGVAFEQYQQAKNGCLAKPFYEAIVELEDVRSQLAATSLGLEFLMEEVNAVKESAESRGQISKEQELMLSACAGLSNRMADLCGPANWMNIIETAKAAERAQGVQTQTQTQTQTQQTRDRQKEPKRVQNAGEKEAGAWNKEHGKFVLVCAIKGVADELRIRKLIVGSIEKSHQETREAASVLPSDGTCDRFARAETAYDRRLYRALALITLKRANGTPSNATVEDRP